MVFSVSSQGDCTYDIECIYGLYTAPSRCYSTAESLKVDHKMYTWNPWLRGYSQMEKGSARVLYYPDGSRIHTLVGTLTSMNDTWYKLGAHHQQEDAESEPASTSLPVLAHFCEFEGIPRLADLITHHGCSEKQPFPAVTVKDCLGTAERNGRGHALSCGPL